MSIVTCRSEARAHCNLTDFISWHELLEIAVVLDAVRWVLRACPSARPLEIGTAVSHRPLA
jgi:hypothetical protein